MKAYTHSFVTDISRTIEVEVTYQFHRGSHGARDSIAGIRGAGPPLEPDEPASVEIHSAVDLATKEEVVLTEEETSQLEQEALEYQESLEQAAAEERAESDAETERNYHNEQ